MSADNGIYLLITPKGDGHEYRVAHLQGVEDYEWSTCPIHGVDLRLGDDGGDRCEECYGTGPTNDPDHHIINAREMWKDSPVFTDEQSALAAALVMYRELEICEYGICDIVIDREF